MYPAYHAVAELQEEKALSVLPITPLEAEKIHAGNVH